MAVKLVLAASAALIGAANADDCFVTGKFYNATGEVVDEPGEDHSLDMYGTFKSIEASATECQRRCNTTLYCDHFSFWPDGGCHLTGLNATLHDATCNATDTNCSGLYVLSGLKEGCGVGETEEGEGGGFPVWAWFLIVFGVLAVIAAGVMYAMGLCSKVRRKKSKAKKADVEAATGAPESAPLVVQAVPTAVEPLTTYVTSGQQVVMSPTYMAQAQPVYIMSGATAVQQ